MLHLHAVSLPPQVRPWISSPMKLALLSCRTASCSIYFYSQHCHYFTFSPYIVTPISLHIFRLRIKYLRKKYVGQVLQASEIDKPEHYAKDPKAHSNPVVQHLARQLLIRVKANKTLKKKGIKQAHHLVWDY